MGRRPVSQTKIETRLAWWRAKRGITQSELAQATGISESTYWRLERGRYRNPPLRYLMNCAIALGCELDELIDDAYREWFVIDQRDAPEPPEPTELWRRPWVPE